jgi:hypothetical protein
MAFIRTERSIGAHKGTVGVTTTKLERQWLDRVMGIIGHEASRESQQLADARNETDGANTPTTELATDLDKSCHELPVWDADIRVYDPEKLANAASSSAAQMRCPVIIGGALSLGLGIAWLGGWISPQFVGAVPRSVPIDHKVASLGSDRPVGTVPPSAVDAPQQAVPAVPTNGKIDGSDSTQKAVRSLDDARTAAIPPQKNASVSPSATVHRRPTTPFPETKPTTIDGWVVREVANGTALLQGPNGVWKVARGDTVPGLGTVDSIVLWGSRWIVATSRGLVTAP